MIAAFNAWMKDYTENPETFRHQFQDVQEFLAEEAQGLEPSYGKDCVGLLKAYAANVAEEPADAADPDHA